MKTVPGPENNSRPFFRAVRDFPIPQEDGAATGVGYSQFLEKDRTVQSESVGFGTEVPRERVKAAIEAYIASNGMNAEKVSLSSGTLEYRIYTADKYITVELGHAGEWPVVAEARVQPLAGSPEWLFGDPADEGKAQEKEK